MKRGGRRRTPAARMPKLMSNAAINNWPMKVCGVSRASKLTWCGMG